MADKKQQQFNYDNASYEWAKANSMPGDPEWQIKKRAADQYASAQKRAEQKKIREDALKQADKTRAELGWNSSDENRDASGDSGERPTNPASAGSSSSTAGSSSSTANRDQLHEKLLKAQCSNADLKQIYDLYAAGKWPWNIGPNTMKWFKKLGFVTKDGSQNGEQSPRETPKNGGQSTADPDAWKQWAATHNGQDYRKRLARHIASLGTVDPSAVDSTVDSIMADVYGTHGDVDKMRELQTGKYKSIGPKFDISGKGRTDGSVARGVAANWTQGPDGQWLPRETAKDKMFLSDGNYGY